MKIINRIISLLVGAIFIFSGLIKLNDPMGMQIKLEEYFEVFATDQELYLSALSGFWEFLIPYSLTIAVFLSVFEVALGVNLLLQYRTRSTLWSLFLMIIFFTFLTFYSAYFNKVTDCGCFGDAIKLTPWQSFSKDIILLLLISVMFFQRQPFPNERTGWIKWGLSIAATIGSFVLAYYAIQHLPPLDFRPYKIGASIPDNMKPSEELRYGPEQYVYTNLETRKDEKYNQEEYLKVFQKLSDTTKYKYKEFTKPLLNPEAQAKITDFSVFDAEGNNLTEEIFKGDKLLIIISEIERTNPSSIPGIDNLSRQLEKTKVKPLVLTAEAKEKFESFRHTYQFAVQHVYFVDKTVLKTMIRSNPGLIWISNGVVRNKWHYNDLPTIKDFE